ncbi:MAG: M48 family metallopeptidase [Bacteroidales bacterium]
MVNVDQSTPYLFSHPELGEIIFHKKQCIRGIRIIVKGSRLVQVNISHYISYRKANAFLLEKQEWIKEAQRRMLEIEHLRTHFLDEDIVRMRILAKEYFPPRVAMFAERYGFLFNKISIKNMRSRWGSCSSRNNLNFSLYLMHLPNELIDYVILHELCHTVHHNHSVHFWKLLDFCTQGQARQLAKQVRLQGKFIA